MSSVLKKTHFLMDLEIMILKLVKSETRKIMSS
jgi:hypothetical protein